MTNGRFVLLGLARPRSPWLDAVGRWVAEGSLPADLVRCLSVEDLRARLRSTRRFSAALVDAEVVGLDRDLVELAGQAGCAVVVVGGEPNRDWSRIGVGTVVASDPTRQDLADALASAASPVPAVLPAEPVASDDEPTAGWLVAVTGPGGTGASVTAIALAQGLARPVAPRRRRGGRRPVRWARRHDGHADASPSVLLADLCRQADQAVLHDTRVLVPGIQEVVEAHRFGAPSLEDLHDQSFEVDERGYRLLLGLRRARHWVAVPPRAFATTLERLRHLAGVVVADIDPDVDGEPETGSADVDDRHAMSRATLARADLVVAVGEPSTKGVHALVRLVAELVEVGVPAERILPIVNRAPRSPRARAEIVGGVARLVAAATGSTEHAARPRCLPVSDVDAALRDGVALPGPAPRLLATTVHDRLDRLGPRMPPAAPAPVPIVPGSLAVRTAVEP